MLHNRESGALQYAMRDRLMGLGWSQIEVIDDDLGRSAAGSVQRAGFERMVAEVCLALPHQECYRRTDRQDWGGDTESDRCRRWQDGSAWVRGARSRRRW